MDTNWVFVDYRVEDREALLAGLGATSEWRLVGADEDGLRQIRAALDGQSDVASIRIVAHGRPGGLLLGATDLTRKTLARHLDDAAWVGRALAADGDIQIYGCEVGSGAVGRDFVKTLAAAFGAPVAASSTPVGHAGLGGDWRLDVGEVRSEPLAVPQWRGLLHQLVIPIPGGGGGGGSGYPGPDNWAPFLKQWHVKASPVTVISRESTGGDGSSIAAALDLVRVTANWGASAALAPDGSVGTWKYLDWSREYGGDSSAVASRLVDVRHVYATGGAFAALRGDGAVVTWGSADQGGDSRSVADKLNGTTRVTQVFSTENLGSGAFAALREDGSVVTWGDSFSGGASEWRWLDGTNDVQQLYANDVAFAALFVDGSVYAWGSYFGGGRLGDHWGELHDPTNRVTEVFTTRRAFAALRADGSVVAWGDESFGGDPTAVADKLNGTTRVTQVFSTEYAFAALRTDGSVVTWGSTRSGGDSSAVAAQLEGTNDAGDVVKVFSTHTAFAALRADGSVVTWGNSQNGGDSSAVAGQIDGTTKNVVDVYWASTLYGGAFAALCDDGSVVTWGDARWGGDSRAVADKLAGSTEQTKVIHVYASGSAFAALRADGSVVTWGGADFGGDSRDVAGALDGTIKVTEIHPLHDGFAAVRADGWIIAWGGTAFRGRVYAYAVGSNAATEGNDDLIGSAGAEIIKGRAGSDRLDGLAGNDLLLGGDGDDTLLGGDGHDTLLGNDDNDSLNGGNGNDTLQGGLGNNVLDGGAGTDTLSYAYATASVTVSLATAAAQVTGGSGTDTVLNFENLTGSGFNDQLTGDTNANTLTGGLGDDTLDGGDGADTLTGGDGSDFYYVDHAGDIVSETNAASAGGADLVHTALGSYTLGENIENGWILAAGAANLTGNRLDNVLYGGVGNNTLDGADGNDTLTGGAGSDTFAAAAGSGVDTVTDFAAGAGGDRAALATNRFLNYSFGSNPFASGYARLTQSGTDTLLELDPDGASAGWSFQTALILQDLVMGSLVPENLIWPVDDYGDHPTDTTPPIGSITPGSTRTGNIEIGGDHDVFEISLTAGTAYTIELKGAPTGSGTLQDPYLRLRINAATIVASNDDNGSNPNSLLTFTPASSGTYYVDAAAYSSSATGTYLVSVSAPPDPIAPTLTGLLPVDDATGVALDSNIVLTFSESVQAGAGNILIYHANDTTARTIAVTDTTQVSVSGNTVTVNPSSDLVAGASYYINIASGVIRDMAGNAFAGISGQTEYNFATIDVTPNHPPSGADRTVSTREDNAYVFSAADFGFSDPADSPAHALLAVRISTLPAAGSLTRCGVPVTAGQSISATDLATGQLAFTPTGNENGAAYASFTFQVQDDGGTDNGGADLDPTPDVITIDALPLIGTNDNDHLVAGPHNNFLDGRGGNDRLFGQAGNDTLTGGLGNDSLSGGGGTDTALFSGLWRRYTLTGNPGTSASLSGPDGSDSLSGIEKLQFVDGTLNGGVWTFNGNAASIARLYLGALGRGPDAGGAIYWTGVLDSGQKTVAQVAEALFRSPEFKHTYDGVDNVGFVNLLYQNVLGRPADPGGRDYWVEQVSKVGRAAVGLKFTDSAEAANRFHSLIDHGIVTDSALLGTESANALVGGTQAEFLVGGGGNDTLTGGLGNDTLVGGTGTDTAVFNGLWRPHSLSGNPAGNATGSGSITGPDGSDSLAGIEKLQFIDGSLSVDPQTGNGSWQLNGHAASAARLYWGALGRGPDAGGAIYWTGVLDKGQMTLAQEAAAFVGSSEFHSRYGSLDNGQFVNKLYQNVLGRAADAGGLSYWTGQLGSKSRAEITLAFTESPEFKGRVHSLIDYGIVTDRSVLGTEAANTLAGTAQADFLVGGGGKDTLAGSDGNDTLVGGAGNDSLSGGSGQDSFRFDSLLNASNRDTISDFSVVDDTLELDHAVFTALTPGILAVGSFRSGPSVTSAADGNDFLIYDSSSGALYYDTDGNDAAVAVQFATVASG